MASIEEKVENLIKKPINDLGYELYDVIYTKEGKDYFLRIYIDKDNISICAWISACKRDGEDVYGREERQCNICQMYLGSCSVIP